MLKNINPTETSAWLELQTLFSKHSDMQISSLFSQNENRFEQFSRQFNSDLLVDFSKNLITDEIFNSLFKLAEEVDLSAAIKAQFSGETINVTESRCSFAYCTA